MTPIEWFTSITLEEQEIVKIFYEMEVENFDHSYDESLVDQSIKDMIFLK